MHRLRTLLAIVVFAAMPATAAPTFPLVLEVDSSTPLGDEHLTLVLYADGTLDDDTGIEGEWIYRSRDRRVRLTFGDDTAALEGPRVGGCIEGEVMFIGIPIGEWRGCPG